jgi:hypothetical protein
MHNDTQHKGLYVTLSIAILCHSAECHYGECRVLLTVMLNVIMLCVVMLSVVMLSVVAPLNFDTWRVKKVKKHCIVICKQWPCSSLCKAFNCTK